MTRSRTRVAWLIFLAAACAAVHVVEAGEKDKPLDVIENSIGMKLVLIPAGEFDMGSPAGQEGRYVDETQHHVRLTKDFFLGQTEVTVGQFRRFVTDKGYKTEAETDGRGGYGFTASAGKFEGSDPKYNWRNTGFTQTDEHPVVNVTWNDAQEFLKWLSGKEQAEYRLPTEAEWEYACRAGTKTRFSSGDIVASLKVVANIADRSLKAKYKYVTAESWNDKFALAAPVGRFRANAFKLFDMHGNVWEWCADRYGDYPAAAATDPNGPDSGDARVIRGGSWLGKALGCRCAYRDHHLLVTERHYLIGFRVASSSALRPIRP